MRIYIDRPHGCGQDRGADSILNEEIWADKMIDLVVSKLKSLGHTVLAQRPSGNLTVSQSLNWRCQQANNWSADIFISNHNNAGGGYGAEVYTYNRDMLDEATRYLQYIIDHGGSVHDNNRKSASAGVKNGNDLAVIRGTSMKAMLVENFYVDTQSDCDFFSSNLEMFANALVYGITGVDLESKNTIVEEEKKAMVKGIVVYANDAEVTYAVQLARKLGYVAVWSGTQVDYSVFPQENIWAVGGGRGSYTGYLLDSHFITGANRDETLINFSKVIQSL